MVDRAFYVGSKALGANGSKERVITHRGEIGKTSRLGEVSILDPFFIVVVRKFEVLDCILRFDIVDDGNDLGASQFTDVGGVYLELREAEERPRCVGSSGGGRYHIGKALVRLSHQLLLIHGGISDGAGKLLKLQRAERSSFG